MEVHHISSDFLTIQDIAQILEQRKRLVLREDTKQKILSNRQYLERKIEESTAPIYGINTGFGSLCNTEISHNDLNQLQENLVISHAAGMGEEISSAIVRLILLLKIQGLSQGFSGVRLATVQRLLDFFNEGIYPVIYEQGSLGASGDLAPLAHLSLALIGRGEVNYQGERKSTKEVLAALGWEPLELHAKEGLALLNGTQFMSAYATHILMRLEGLSNWCDASAALSIEAFNGRIEPFDALIQEVRPHEGQKQTAQNIRSLLEGSQLIHRKDKEVQDPYCLRCVPQVHGASKDAIAYARKVVETEINGVTDNPTLFEAADKVISAGNFHGQPLALALDFLGIAVAELASISERRTYKLLSGQRGLPPFLVANPGLNSGFMIAQYTAASAVSQNKQLATPASVDSIDSSNGQEDHVSMGANAATKCLRIVDNLEKIVSIEWFAAAQAKELADQGKSSELIESLVADFRKQVPFLEQDEEMYRLMHASREYIRSRNPF